MTATEIWTDPENGAVVINETAVSTDLILTSLAEQHPQLASLVRWGSQQRRGGIFERDRFVTPKKIFEQMQVAQEAAESDDVVAGVLESSEALAFNRMSIQCDDEDEEDIWNQIIEEMGLETRMREMWRELFTVSQFYAANWWGTRSFKVRGRSKDGVKRKKEFKGLRVPISVSLLDPLKVVPIGNFMLNSEELAWVADDIEGRMIHDLLQNHVDDNSVERQLLVGRYTPNQSEEKRLSALGVPTRNLFKLDPKLVWRHTATRPQYKALAEVRMRSVFELLDMKVLLREMDRAHLLGATNFIVLVKLGTDERPGKQAEIDALQSQVRALSKVPLIVGDHRIDIEIITPSIDLVLQADKWNVLDARITARLYQMFMCVDDQTQALTTEGWKSHGELRDNDLILTLNTETNTSEWLPAKINRFDAVDHKMLLMETNSISSLTTLNHRWWIQQNTGVGGNGDRIWQWRESDSLTAHSKIPLAFPHAQFPSEEILPDALVELVAWFWTEGYVRGNRVFISQSRSANPQKCDRIAAACQTLWGSPAKVAEGGLWYEYVNPQNAAVFNICAAVGPAILACCGEGKLPRFDFLLSLTERQLQIFIDTAIDADGCRNGSKVSFFQKDQRGIEAFEFACALAGIPTSTKRHNDTITKVTLLKNRFTRPHYASYQNSTGARVEYQMYTGTVWCPSTSNLTFLARRNGSVYWTGNTGNFAAGTRADDSIKLARIVTRGMESRRHLLRKAVEKHVLLPILERNSQLKEIPTLVFHPKQIALDFDAGLAAMFRDARDRREISRATFLEQMDLDQDEEAKRREREAESYDEIFDTLTALNDPKQAAELQQQMQKQQEKFQEKEAEKDRVFQDEQNEKTGQRQQELETKKADTQVKLAEQKPDPKSAGRSGGGTRNGGGAAPGSGQGQPRDPRRKAK